MDVGQTGGTESVSSGADSTPTTVDATLDAAFADVSSGSAATSQPEASPAPVQTPAPARTEPQQPSADGPIPLDRHTQILANAREKAKQEAWAQWQHQYGGPLSVAQALQADFTGTIQQLLSEAVEHPEYGPAVVAQAARLLSGRRGAKAPEVNAEPEPDLQTADGQLVYSADQLRAWYKWNAQQQEQKLYERLQPFQQIQDRVQQADALRQLTTDATNRAKDRSEAWKGMPFFEDHKAAILERQQAMFEEMKAQAVRGERRFNPNDAPWEALQRAYQEIVTQKALPTLQAKQQQSLIQAAVAKSTGSRPDPAASAPAQPRRPRTPDEALDMAFASFDA